MSDPVKNPEQRSNGAIWLIVLGLGLGAIAYALGVGAMLTAWLTGGDPVGIAGSIGMAVAMPITFVVGVILSLIGGIWLVIQVIADGRAPDKYSRDVER